MKLQKIELPLYVYPKLHIEREKNNGFSKQIAKALEEHQKTVLAKEFDKDYLKIKIAGCYQNIITKHLTSKGLILIHTELAPNFDIIHTFMGFLDEFNNFAFMA